MNGDKVVAAMMCSINELCMVGTVSAVGVLLFFFVSFVAVEWAFYMCKRVSRRKKERFKGE